MRFPHTVFTSLAAASLLTGLSSAAHSVNLTAALDLPDCVKQCGLKILPEYNCLIGEDCWCKQSGPLSDKLSNCILSDCPQLNYALEGLKFQATTCGYPTDRNLSRVTSGVAFTLFGLATFFLLARFLSRWRFLKGAGYSWDDGKHHFGVMFLEWQSADYFPCSHLFNLLHSCGGYDHRSFRRVQAWFRT